MTKKTVVVISGLGDDGALDKIRKIVNGWQDKNLKVHVFDSRWETNESSEEKSDRLNEFINDINTDNLYLVAYSAGGALATRLYSERAGIIKCVLVSCKLKGSNSIGHEYQQRAPALLDSVRLSEDSIRKLSSEKKKRIVCLIPIFDEVVSKKDMYINGAKKKLIPFLFHAPSIGFALIFQVKRLIESD